MNNKLVRSIVAGIAGTVVMTIIMKVGGMMGMPKMDPPGMMANLLGAAMPVGFVIHFLIGITWGAVFVYLFNPKVGISNPILKGIVFGLVAFVFAMIGMKTMGISAAPEGTPMIKSVMAALVGHMFFGIVVAMVAKKRA